jgi:selenium metabolism protein YedF
MTVTTVDARGQLCPKPLILAKKALNDPATGPEFLLLIDNATSRENVERFLADNKVPFRTARKGNEYHLTVSRSGKAVTTPTEGYCPDSPATTTGTHMVCITGETMGRGDETLGAMLMKGFIDTLKEIEPLPRRIAFYNGGVKLAVEGSPHLSALRELESRGVELLVCGNCVDFYGLKEQVAVGRISNGYEVLGAITDASKIIYP